MTDLLTALCKGITAFTATNLDDIIILMLFFSQIGSVFRRRHIVLGQYLGFALLVLASLPGFLGNALFPRPWIGLLGIVPIVIGLSQIFASDAEVEAENEAATALTSPPPGMPGWFSPQTASVAAITVANGGDNIGIYMPLFASTDEFGLGVILSVFFGLVGVWCYGAYWLTRVGEVASLLTRYGNALVPFVLIGLGVLILVDSHTLEYRGLTTLALTILGICTIHLVRTIPSITPVEPPPEKIKG